MNLEPLKKNKILKYAGGGILALTIVSLLISVWLGVEQSFRIVFGSFYLLFLPGLLLTFLFFKEKEIDIIERVALSFALSIAIVPFFVFYLNLIGMKINALNVFLVVALIITAAIVGIVLKKRVPKSC